MTSTDTAPQSADTLVRVAGPLPLDVAGSLMRAVGTMYPNAMAQTATGRDALVMRIPEADRTAGALDGELVPDAVDDPTLVGDLIGMDDGVMKVATPEEASLAFAQIAVAMLAHPGVVNYLETEVHDDEGNSYVVIAARSKGQTPHALRRAAESHAAALETAIRAAVDALGPLSATADGDPATAAALEALTSVLPSPQGSH